MMRGASAAGYLALLVAFAGCVRDEAPEPKPAQPLVVYAAGLDRPDLEERLAEFSRVSGLPVDVYQGDNRQLVDDVIHHAGDPAADVLLSQGVYGAWRAADEGGLRPLADGPGDGRVPAGLRDPEGSWIAVDFHPVAIVYDVRALAAGDVAGWDSLAGQALAGRLCLSSSTLPGNRSLIATLIRDLGPRPAEILVRKWLQNLARPVFSEQGALLSAIAAGECAAGIVSLDGNGKLPGGLTGVLRHRSPDPPAADVVAAGVTRHAAQPEAANQFVAWLIAESVLGTVPQAADPTGRPVADVSVNGWLAEDAAALAERAAYP